MIDVKNVTTILDNKVVHNGLNIRIDTGETKVVIGVSGGGKSVLIKIINRLIVPDEGSVYFDDVNILKANARQLKKIRSKISVLFQGAALFDSMSILENVAFPLRRFTKMKDDEIKDIAIEKLAMVGLKNIEKKFPSEISGGMAKRVGLARAIIIDPEYIFYDEPTTGIDPVMGGIINDLIIRMKEELNVTSIVVTHDMVSAFTVGTKIAMLYGGRIIFEGTPEEIKNCDNIHVKNFINGEAEEIPEKLEFL